MKKIMILTAALLAFIAASAAAAPPPPPPAPPSQQRVQPWHRRTAIEQHRTERRTDRIAGRQVQKTRERQQRFEDRQRSSQ